MIYFFVIGLLVAGVIALVGYDRWRHARTLARDKARRERHFARQQAWDEMVGGSAAPAGSADGAS